MSPISYSAPTTITTGQLVTASLMNTDWGGNIAFLANRPFCRVYHSGNVSLNNNTLYVLGTTAGSTTVFDSERWDTDTMHSTVTNPGRITIKTAGVYTIYASISFAANASGYRQGYFQVNGATIIGASTIAAAGATPGTDLLFETKYKFAVNDYIELAVRQTSGGALNLLSAANYTPEFGAIWECLG